MTLLLLCLVFSMMAADVSEAASGGTRRELSTQEREAVRDTVPRFRYDFGVAAGYDRIKESSQSAERYASLAVLPEVYYRKFGVGLLAKVRVNSSTGVREEDFDSVRDYLALIRFVEYGTEEDPEGYGRFGSIENVSLGGGLFVDRYSTSRRIDDPMRGLTGAVATPHFYLEGVFSDLAGPGIFGLHTGYYPFETTPTDVFSRLTFGIGIAGDLSEEGDLVNPVRPGAPFLLSRPPDSVNTDVPVGREDGPLFMVGVNASVRWLDTDAVTVATFAEAGKIIGYGLGATLGAQGRTSVGRVDLQVQYAQRFLGKKFLPDYFNSSFEAQRLRSVSLPVSDDLALGGVNTRRNELAGRTSAAGGYQLKVDAEMEDVFETTVGYETILGKMDAGQFQLDLEVHTPSLPVSVRVGYDRFNLESLSNLLTVSRDNSLYRFGLAYEIIEPLRLGVELSQTFDPVYREGRLVGQEKQNRVEPYIRLALRF